MPHGKKGWCPHLSHSSLTLSGSKLFHPERQRISNTMQADFRNNQISSNAE